MNIRYFQRRRFIYVDNLRTPASEMSRDHSHIDDFSVLNGAVGRPVETLYKQVRGGQLTSENFVRQLDILYAGQGRFRECFEHLEAYREKNPLFAQEKNFPDSMVDGKECADQQVKSTELLLRDMSSQIHGVYECATTYRKNHDVHKSLSKQILLEYNKSYTRLESAIKQCNEQRKECSRLIIMLMTKLRVHNTFSSPSNSNPSNSNPSSSNNNNNHASNILQTAWKYAKTPIVTLLHLNHSNHNTTTTRQIEQLLNTLSKALQKYRIQINYTRILQRVHWEASTESCTRWLHVMEEVRMNVLRQCKNRLVSGQCEFRRGTRETINIMSDLLKEPILTEEELTPLQVSQSKCCDENGIQQSTQWLCKSKCSRAVFGTNVKVLGGGSIAQRNLSKKLKLSGVNTMYKPPTESTSHDSVDTLTKVGSIGCQQVRRNRVWGLLAAWAKINKLELDSNVLFPSIAEDACEKTHKKPPFPSQLHTVGGDHTSDKLVYWSLPVIPHDLDQSSEGDVDLFHLCEQTSTPEKEEEEQEKCHEACNVSHIDNRFLRRLEGDAQFDLPEEIDTQLREKHKPLAQVKVKNQSHMFNTLLPQHHQQQQTILLNENQQCIVYNIEDSTLEIVPSIINTTTFQTAINQQLSSRGKDMPCVSVTEEQKNVQSPGLRCVSADVGRDRSTSFENLTNAPSLHNQASLVQGAPSSSHIVKKVVGPQIALEQAIPTSQVSATTSSVDVGNNQTEYYNTNPVLPFPPSSIAPSQMTTNSTNLNSFLFPTYNISNNMNGNNMNGNNMNGNNMNGNNMHMNMNSTSNNVPNNITMNNTSNNVPNNIMMNNNPMIHPLLGQPSLLPQHSSVLYASNSFDTSNSSMNSLLHSPSQPHIHQQPYCAVPVNSPIFTPARATANNTVEEACQTHLSDIQSAIEAKQRELELEKKLLDTQSIAPSTSTVASGKKSTAWNFGKAGKQFRFERGNVRRGSMATTIVDSGSSCVDDTESLGWEEQPVEKTETQQRQYKQGNYDHFLYKAKQQDCPPSPSGLQFSSVPSNLPNSLVDTVINRGSSPVMKLNTVLNQYDEENSEEECTNASINDFNGDCGDDCNNECGEEELAAGLEEYSIQKSDNNDTNNNQEYTSELQDIVEDQIQCNLNPKSPIPGFMWVLVPIPDASKNEVLKIDVNNASIDTTQMSKKMTMNHNSLRNAGKPSSKKKGKKYNSIKSYPGRHRRTTSNSTDQEEYNGICDSVHTERSIPPLDFVENRKLTNSMNRTPPQCQLPALPTILPQDNMGMVISPPVHTNVNSMNNPLNSANNTSNSANTTSNSNNNTSNSTNNILNNSNISNMLQIPIQPNYIMPNVNITPNTILASIGMLPSTTSSTQNNNIPTHSNHNYTNAPYNNMVSTMITSNHIHANHTNNMGIMQQPSVNNIAQPVPQNNPVASPLMMSPVSPPMMMMNNTVNNTNNSNNPGCPPMLHMQSSQQPSYQQQQQQQMPYSMNSPITNNSIQFMTSPGMHNNPISYGMMQNQNTIHNPNNMNNNINNMNINHVNTVYPPMMQSMSCPNNSDIYYSPMLKQDACIPQNQSLHTTMPAYSTYYSNNINNNNSPITLTSPPIQLLNSIPQPTMIQSPMKQQMGEPQEFQIQQVHSPIQVHVHQDTSPVMNNNINANNSYLVNNVVSNMVMNTPPSVNLMLNSPNKPVGLPITVDYYHTLVRLPLVPLVRRRGSLMVSYDPNVCIVEPDREVDEDPNPLPNPSNNTEIEEEARDMVHSTMTPTASIPDNATMIVQDTNLALLEQIPRPRTRSASIQEDRLQKLHSTPKRPTHQRAKSGMEIILQQQDLKNIDIRPISPVNTPSPHLVTFSDEFNNTNENN